MGGYLDIFCDYTQNIQHTRMEEPLLWLYWYRYSMPVYSTVVGQPVARACLTKQSFFLCFLIAWKGEEETQVALFKKELDADCVGGERSGKGGKNPHCE